MFKIAESMVKANQYSMGEQCKINDDGVLTVSDEDNKITWKSYHAKVMNTEFAWNRNSFPHAYTFSGEPHI